MFMLPVDPLKEYAMIRNFNTMKKARSETHLVGSGRKQFPPEASESAPLPAPAAGIGGGIGGGGGGGGGTTSAVHAGAAVGVGNRSQKSSTVGALFRRRFAPSKKVTSSGNSTASSSSSPSVHVARGQSTLSDGGVKTVRVREAATILDDGGGAAAGSVVGSVGMSHCNDDYDFE